MNILFLQAQTMTITAALLRMEGVLDTISTYQYDKQTPSKQVSDKSYIIMKLPVI